MIKLGEILIKKEIITQNELEAALEESKRTGEVLGKVLLRMKIITEEQLLQTLGEQLDIKFIASLKDMAISAEALKIVPAKLVWHYKFMPTNLEGKTLTIAVSDPLAVWAMEDLKLQLGLDIERVLTTEEEILKAIRYHYGLGAETVEQILKDKKESKEEESAPMRVKEEIEDLENSAEAASVISLVNQILSEAITSRATDIHMELYRSKLRIRYRIDGILYDIRVPEQIKLLYRSIVSRIKILSNLNVVERRVPQDGRAIVKVKKQQVDLRISIIPSIYGENVVIRLLPVNLLFKLQELGLQEEELKILDELTKRPHGIIFLTGPTGSGKTTTLYACLSKLNKEKVKIITIEDPVEYELENVTQIQVRPEVGLTFASALRSVLRHDPDIMMLGEVRDAETAELAIRTSLTGHLMFSTLHTNDAPSGVTRLLDIGIEPFLVASSVNAFISQRLVRKICPKCKTKRKDYKPTSEPFKGIDVFYGKGCEDCGSIGYKGRVAIFEMLIVDNQIRDLITQRATSVQIKKKAQEAGFKTLLEVGIEKVKEGITTPEEVMRVVEII